MKLLIIGWVTGILGLVILFISGYWVYLIGWRNAPEVILSAVIGAAVGVAICILGFKVMVAAVLKLNYF